MTMRDNVLIGLVVGAIAGGAMVIARVIVEALVAFVKGLFVGAEVPAASRRRLERLLNETTEALERERHQHAACLLLAEGTTRGVPVGNDSPAMRAVRELRARYDRGERPVPVVTGVLRASVPSREILARPNAPEVIPPQRRSHP